MITEKPLKAENHRMHKWTPRETSFHRMLCHEAPGTFNGVSVDALPDTGSSVDAISEHFAKQHGLEIIAAGAKSISLPGGSEVKSVGVVVGDFLFQNEAQVYRREFQVLKNSVYDLVLGRDFLRLTETLTKCRHRIIEKIRPGIRKGRHLFLLDDSPEECLRCTVNGAEAVALPDTGSDLMVVSGEFARRNKFNVLHEEKYRQHVELINGSIIRTSGMVLNAELQFDVPDTAPYLDCDRYLELTDNLSSILGKNKPRSTPHLTFVSDLHVIEDLPCDIILSSEFIFRNQIYSRFKGLFCSTSTESQNGTASLDRSLLVLRETKTQKPLAWIRRLRQRSQVSTAAQLVSHEAGASYEEGRNAEMSRRNLADRHISTLDDKERTIEERKEEEERVLWERDNPNPQQTQNMLSAGVDPGGQSAGGGLTLSSTTSSGGSAGARLPGLPMATASSSGPVAAVATRAPMAVASEREPRE